MNSNKFYNPSSVHIASTLNEQLKRNYGYELKGDLQQLKESRQELIEMMERGEGNATENLMLRNTIEALIKAHQESIIERAVSEDTTSDDGRLELKTTWKDTLTIEFDVYLDDKKVGKGSVDLQEKSAVFYAKDKIMDIRDPRRGINIDMSKYKTVKQAIKSEVFDNPKSIYNKPIGIKDINLPKPDDKPMTDKEKKDQSDWLAQQYADNTLYDSKQPKPNAPDSMKAAMRKRIEKHQAAKAERDDWWDDEEKPKKRKMGGKYGYGEIDEASTVNGRDTSKDNNWKQTSMSPSEAKAKGYEVRVKKGALRNGDDMVEVRKKVEEAVGQFAEPYFDLIDRVGGDAKLVNDEALAWMGGRERQAMSKAHYDGTDPYEWNEYMSHDDIANTITRWFSGDDVKQFVDHFERHYDLGDDVEESVTEGRMKDELWDQAEMMDLEDFVANAGDFGMDEMEAAEFWKTANGMDESEVNEAPEDYPNVVSTKPGDGDYEKGFMYFDKVTGELYKTHPGYEVKGSYDDFVAGRGAQKSGGDFAHMSDEELQDAINDAMEQGDQGAAEEYYAELEKRSMGESAEEYDIARDRKARRANKSKVVESYAIKTIKNVIKESKSIKFVAEHFNTKSDLLRNSTIEALTDYLKENKDSQLDKLLKMLNKTNK